METFTSNSTGEKFGEKTPKVSIIIPIFNYARYLGEAIDSALSNKHIECEILVIDDGSTDNTADVARSYESQIRYIYQENQGVCAARNKGIREARAELIVFLDADDVLEPDMVKHSLAALQKLGDSFALIATHSPLVIQEIPSKRVIVFERNGNTTEAKQLPGETFGENLSDLTRHIFETYEIPSHYKKVLRNIARDNSYEDALSCFPKGLSMNARSYLLSCYPEGVED